MATRRSSRFAPVSAEEVGAAKEEESPPAPSPWLDWEDDVILFAQSARGKGIGLSFEGIAENLPGRTAEAVRLRWEDSGKERAESMSTEAYNASVDAGEAKWRASASGMSALGNGTVVMDPMLAAPGTGLLFQGDTELTIHSEDLSDIASIYCMIRTFSWQLKLSPFSLKAFACSLAAQRHSQLLDEVHLSFMRLLLLDMVPEDRAAFGMNVSFLDHQTWPEFVWQYLEFKHEQKLQKIRAESGNAKSALQALHGVEPDIEFPEEDYELHDPLTVYKYHVVDKGPVRDTLASFKRENVNRDLGLKVTLDVVEDVRGEAESRGNGQDGEVEEGSGPSSSWCVKLNLDWGEESFERVEKVRKAMKIDESAERAGAKVKKVRRSKEYHFTDLRGKISIMQRLCDDLLDCSVMRCEMWQREEYGMRTVMRFTTLLHTLNTRQDLTGPGRKSLSKQFTPSAKALAQTPKKRGRPPKWASSKTPGSGKKSRGGGDEDYVPKGSHAMEEEDDDRDHNVDACVLCGLGGNLLCCEGCPAAFHVRCAGENNKVIMSDGIWLCEECKLRKENEGRFSDSLQFDLMTLKKVTSAPRKGKKKSTWQIQDFAFQCAVIDTEVEAVTRSRRPSRKSKGKKKAAQGPQIYVGSSAPISVEWKCKVLPIQHPIEGKDMAAEYLSGGFEEEVKIAYFKDSLDTYVNKYRNAWGTLFNEMTTRSKSRGSDKSQFAISKYVWPTRIGRGQKSLQKLPLCNVHPHAHMMIVYLSRTERLLWGLLEENWSNYPTWRSKWINSVFRSTSPHELGIRLLELERALSERARYESWYETADPRLLSNRMREDPQKEIRSVQKYIGLKLGELKLGEYIDRPQSYQPVHPVRPGKKKPWPYRLYPTGEKSLLTWRKNKQFLGRNKMLPMNQTRKIARQGGVVAAEGCLYPNKRYGVVSTQQEWRIRAEEVETFSELAVLVREFDSSLKWEEISYVGEENIGMKVLDRRTTAEVWEEDGVTYHYNEYLCTKKPPVPPYTPYGAPTTAAKSEPEWLREENVPLKLVKDFIEIHRMENSKSERYFLRVEHLHPGLTGLSVAVYWPEEGRWYNAKLMMLPKDRGVKLTYASGDQETLDKLSFEQALLNQELSVVPEALKDRLAKAKAIEKQIRDENEARIKAEKEAKEQRRLERERERQSKKTELTEEDHKRLKLVNKAILDACVRISTGRDTTKGKKSKEWVASFIPRNVLNVLLQRAERGELKPFCMEEQESQVTSTVAAAQPDIVQQMQIPVVGVVPEKGEDRNGKTLSAEHYEPVPSVPSAVSRMTKENQDRCLKIIEQMLDVKQDETIDSEYLATPFLHLPSRKLLPDYYRIITAPVDIGSIRQCLNRTKTNNYAVVQDFIRDVELMFSNARTYNQDESEVYTSAVRLQKWFWGQIGELFPFITESNWAEHTSDKLAARAAAKAQAMREVSKKAKLKAVAKAKSKEAAQASKAAVVPAKKERPLKDRLLAALSVVKDVMKLPESFAFQDPVDVELIPVYGQIIKNPMDLGTIRKQLEAGRDIGWNNLVYSHEDEVFRDVKLVWNNCRLFNRGEDPIYQQSLVIEPAFDILWALRMSCPDYKKYTINTNKPEIVLTSPEKCVGFRVGIWWPRSLCFFYGDIMAYEKEKHRIKYDDDTFACVTLTKHHIHWCDDRFNFKYSFSMDGMPVDASQIEGIKAKSKSTSQKSGPPETPPTEEAAIGWRLGLLWEEDNTYYYGIVNGYDEDTGTHSVLYDDGTLENLDLSEVKIEWVEQTLPEDAEVDARPKQQKQHKERKRRPSIPGMKCGVCRYCRNPKLKKGCLNKVPTEMSDTPPEKKAKTVPASKDPKGADAVGWRVGVWWEDDKTYYYGVLKDYDKKEKKHKILYDDDQVEDWIVLTEEKLEWKEKDASASSLEPPQKEAAIGWRVGVLWEDDKTYYYGVVHAYDASAGTHNVIYEDGTMESLNLSKVKVEWVEQETQPKGGKKSSSVGSKPSKPKAKKSSASSQKKPPQKEAAIGWRVGVLWEDDKTYYYGVVHAYDASAGTHNVIYEDGTMESLNLSKVKVEWVEQVAGKQETQPKGDKKRSAGGSSKSQKKAKAVPASKDPKGADAVGWRVGVWWEDDKTYYYGVLKDYDKKEKKHKILYDDGQQEMITIEKEKLEWKEGPSKPKAKKSSASSQKKPPQKEAAIGWRVGVLWEDDKTYYYGVVHAYDASAGTHNVIYEDGTMESLNLSKVKVEWVEQVPLSAPKGAPEPEKKGKKAKKKSKSKNNVGQRIGIWWPDDKCFYYGEIAAFREADKMHQIKYDDGMEEFLDLQKQEVDWKGQFDTAKAQK
ncbi:bromodomain-containing protein [Chloropicon primus]|nr:bromodomain-containing protein [Chloropicon primus]